MLKKQAARLSYGIGAIGFSYIYMAISHTVAIIVAALGVRPEEFKPPSTFELICSIAFSAMFYKDMWRRSDSGLRTVIVLLLVAESIASSYSIKAEIEWPTNVSVASDLLCLTGIVAIYTGPSFKTTLTTMKEM